MLLVKTRLGLSPIEGIGLFAAEPIKKGTVTWRFLAGYDRQFTSAEIEALPEPARSETLRHVYAHAATGTYVLCIDNARFMNHAEDPNTCGVHTDGAVDGYDVAARDIADGEELTCDYRTFDASFKDKLGIE